MNYQQRQLTNSVVMVRPHDFGYNEQTGTDNEFQHRPGSAAEAVTISKQAMLEFEKMVNTLSNAGIEVLILDKPQTISPLPDAIFPNNWFSTTADGRLFLYPMKTINRQAEVQQAELQALLNNNHYLVTEVIDLRNMTMANEQTMQSLEGTGSLVFHHPTATVFAAISERCGKAELEYFASKYQYDVFPFRSHSQASLPIYHTNVLMTCGEGFAVIAEQVLVQDKDSKAAMNRLKESTKDIVNITEQQMSENFCGNILQMSDNNQQPVILMSESAFNGFTRGQLAILEKHGSLIICPIPTIEYIGGGSARCMIAENYLPKST